MVYFINKSPVHGEVLVVPVVGRGFFVPPLHYIRLTIKNGRLEVERSRISEEFEKHPTDIESLVLQYPISISELFFELLDSISLRHTNL